MHPDDRPKAVLRAVYQHGKERNRWPDVEDLRRFRKHLGCRTTIQVTLRYLRDVGLVELRQTASGDRNARWIATDAGCALLGRPVFVPALERERAACDAAVLFFSSERANHSRPAIPDNATLIRLRDSLPVVG